MAGNAVLTIMATLALLFPAPSGADTQTVPTIYLCRDGQATPVARPDVGLGGAVEADAAALLFALLAGPTPVERSQGITSPLPPGAKLAGVSALGDKATVDLVLPSEFLEHELDVYRSDAIVELIVKTLHPLELHHIHVRAGDESGEFAPLSSYLPAPTVVPPVIPGNNDPFPEQLGMLIAGAGADPEYTGQPPVHGQGQPQGALSGKSVWLSAGHGWYWSETLGRWTTQRGNNYGIVEDFSNAEAVNYYLARYLWNAGADVWLVRERAMTEHEVIVDNDAGAPAYSETGTWTSSNYDGYMGGSYRYATSGGSPPATATWTPNLPEAGLYPVWAWFRHGTNRTADTGYEIHHAGGPTTIHISQEVHGQTWRYLGEYLFDAGTAGHVTMLNESDDPGQAVVADAVRFGGGLGSIPEPGGTSGEPRWEEAAKYWAEYQGAPAHDDDVTARPLYAEWETAKGYPGEAQEAVYISWHTNAGGGTGTESYVHDSEPSPGSIELQDRVHAKLINDLKAAWNPDWANRGQKSADFGELRELSDIAGVLLEVAFHDTEDPGDADDLKEPLFRQIAARAVFQGIVKYHAEREGTAEHLLPEPPARLAARNTGPGEVTLTWAPPACCDGVFGDAAGAYKVYRSADGRAFDNGVETSRTSFDLNSLLPGTAYFFRVTALNEGGESFPTPVVAVRTPISSEAPAFLIVDGFDRLDQAAMIPQYEGPYHGTTQRMFLERMNRFDYAVEHALALGGCDRSHDGATNEAIIAGDVSLHDYPAVDWFTGEDSVADKALDDDERVLLAAYLEGGGRLLISGAEIGYSLVDEGLDPAFYREYLQATYQGDDAETYSFAGVAGGPFDGIVGAFDDSTGGTYDVGYPDRLASAANSTVVINYAGGTGDGAAIAYDGTAANHGSGFRLVHFGFPLETIVDPTVREATLCAAADYLLEGYRPPGAGCAPRIINPGFEYGVSQAAWQVAGPDGALVMAHRDALPGYVAPRRGDWLAWLGGYSPGMSATAALTQVVALPSGEPTATLKLDWFVHAEGGSPSGSLTLGLFDAEGAPLDTLLTLNESSPAGEWQASEFDLGAYAGQTVQVAMQAEAVDTAFFVDEVRLDTCGPSGPNELRALWVDAWHDGIKTRQQVDELVETARAGNINALVVQVRRRGDTYYPSGLDPWAPDADPGFDALATLISRAHAAGIEVHAWATTLAIWSGDTPPAAPDHALNHHGPGATGRDYWLMTNDAGKEQTSDEQYYVDPGHPDAVDYTVAAYAELISYYNLDGVHLDRVRYAGPNWGYNPTAVSRFQAKTGRGDVPAPDDPQWQQWRRDTVTALVRRIYLTVTAIDADLRVSAALSSRGSAPINDASWETSGPYTQDLQDWRAWLEEGILDVGLPMTYRDEDDSADDFDKWATWQVDHQYNRGVAVGTGLYKNAVEDSMAQWSRVRTPTDLGNRALGMSGYSYAAPSDDGAPRRDFVNAVVTEVFTQTASPPAILWKDSPALGHLFGTVLLSPPCSSPLDGHALSLTGPENRALLSDGSGWFGAVDLPPGAYTLSTEVPGTGEPISVSVTVVAGQVSEQQVFVPACETYKIYLPVVRKGASR